MVLSVPARLPSLEEVRDAIETAFRTDITTALVAVNDAAPVTAPDGSLLNVQLRAPVVYRQAIMTDEEVNHDWPTLIILSSAPRMEEGVQQRSSGAGQWRGTVELHYWDEDDSPSMLRRMLDRYGVAMWAVVSGYGAFGGARVIPETFQLATSEDEGATVNARAIGLRFDVLFRT